MRTIISNKIHIINPDTQVRVWCINNLIIKNPTYETLMRIGKEDTIRRNHIQPDMYLYIDK